MFTVRGFTLPLLVFPHPPSKIWFETGFPHICPFDPTSDYFFSGHILLTGLQSIASYNFGACNLYYIYIYIFFTFREKKIIHILFLACYNSPFLHVAHCSSPLYNRYLYCV